MLSAGPLLSAADGQPGTLAPVDLPGRAPHAGNPILPGYYADPSIVQADGKAYLYATLDPWGGETLGCWESANFKDWTYRVLNWPTKEACTSPTSKDAMVWAPSVVRGADGKYHMAVSVGSEVWMGIADHPLGPWRNVLGDRPLISADFDTRYHMIDGELFLDDDGQAYLYWGSGWNWVNGRCFAVKLTQDMSAMAGQVKDVTPGNFFEAAFMVKREGRYFLMYSSGKTIEDTYQVHYAVGDSPLGPFRETDNSPILVTDAGAGILSPGHHSVFRRAGNDYILYHRHSIPFDPEFVGRQICVDRLEFTRDGRIAKVTSTHHGPELVQSRTTAGSSALMAEARATASSQAQVYTDPAAVLDDNYATRWAAAPDAGEAWLQLDLGATKTIERQFIRPEYAWKTYSFLVQASDDGRRWRTLGNFIREPAVGSPIVVQKPVTTRYLRLWFPDAPNSNGIALWEWSLQ